MTQEVFETDDIGRVTCDQCGCVTDWSTPHCPSCGDSLTAERKKVKGPSKAKSKAKLKKMRKDDLVDLILKGK